MIEELIGKEPYSEFQKKVKTLCDEGLEMIRKDLLHTLKVKNMDAAVKLLGEELVAELEKKSVLNKAMEETEAENKKELAYMLGKEVIAAHELVLLDHICDCMQDVVVEYVDSVMENDVFYDDEDLDDGLAEKFAQEYGGGVRKKYHMYSEDSRFSL